MWESARFHLKRGRRVLRLNLRGAGPSAQYASRFYYAGCWPDVVDALDTMAPEAPEGFFIVGISLGGSVTLNTLPNLPDRLDVRGAATLSVPLDPMEAAVELMRPHNVVYHKTFVRAMKAAYRQRPFLTEDIRTRLDRAKTIVEVDDAATGPLHGYASAAEYYAATAGGNFVANARVPLLLVHAENDPWIPPGPYQALRDALPPNVSLTLTHKGGHVGYHGKHGREAWHDLRIDAFMREISL